VPSQTFAKLAHALLTIDCEMRLERRPPVEVIVNAGFKRTQAAAAAPASFQVSARVLGVGARKFAIQVCQ
jgi:hypothetical protein